MHGSSWTRFCVGLLPFLLGGGCGGPRDGKLPATHPVSGTVMYQGQPLRNVEVRFFPEGSGNPALGNAGEDGKFLLTTYKRNDGAVAGLHVVTVQPIEVGVEPGRDAKGANRVPAAYRERGRSPLKVEVEPGANTLELELED